MKQIILDLGAGNNTENKPLNIYKMIDEIYCMQRKTDKELIIKFQLFENIVKLEPLDKKLYCFAYYYAEMLGLKVAASVFDKPSLDFLLSFKNTPFVKIACRNYLYKLIKYIPKDIPVLVSVDDVEKRDELIKKYPGHELNFLYCVPEYPAYPVRYMALFYANLSLGISDHCVTLGLYKKYQPYFYERHFVLEHKDTEDEFGDDFCSTAKELELIL